MWLQYFSQANQNTFTQFRPGICIRRTLRKSLCIFTDAPQNKKKLFQDTRMPNKAHKRKNKKRNNRRRKSGGVQKGIVYHPRDFKIPLPVNYRTEFWCEADYKVPVATAALTGGNIKLNSLFLPFRNGGSTAFPSYTFLGPATEATLEPTGYSTIMSSTLYQYSKVLSCELKLRWNGTNTGNNVILTVVPAEDGTSYSDVFHARTGPFAREYTFNASKPHENVARDGWATYRISPYRVLGLNRTEAKADLFRNQATALADPLDKITWYVFVQTQDNDVTSSSANVLQVRLHYFVELEGINVMPVT